MHQWRYSTSLDWPKKLVGNSGFSVHKHNNIDYIIVRRRIGATDSTPPFWDYLTNHASFLNSGNGIIPRESELIVSPINIY
jgi:hypothetical protein